MDNILDSVNNFAEELLIFQSAYPKDFLKKVLQFDTENLLDVIDSKEITKFIVALSQYTITLAAQYNGARIHCTLLNREFRRKLKVASSEVKGGSVEERESLTINDSIELQEEEKKVEEARAKMEILEGTEKTIIELINGFKSELNRRYHEWEVSHKEYK